MRGDLLHRLGGTVGMAWLLAGCGISQTGGGRVPDLQSGVGSVAAFEKTVYPVVRDKCKSCHGQSQAPLFAVSNSTLGHDRAIEFVRFSEPATSRLAIYGGNSHCGINCSSTTESVIVEEIENWRDLAGEISQSDEDFDYVTPETVLPSLTGGKVTMNWPLDGFGYPGAMFTIEVEQFVDGVYRFGAPKLRAGPLAFAVADLRVLVNGSWDPGTVAYRDVEIHISANQVLTAISTQTMLVFGQDGPGMDKISIAFTRFDGGCASLPLFVSQVKPILANCRGCHDSGVAGYDLGAVRAFDFKGTDATLCFRSLRRSNPNNLSQSDLIQYPLLGTPMFTTPQINATQAESILQWLQAE